MQIDYIYTDQYQNILPTFPEECFDITLTSPPYDNARDYQGYSFDFEPLAEELYRITKPGGVVVWIVGDTTKNFCESLTPFKQAIYFVEQSGFNLLDTMIYHKMAGVPVYSGIKRYTPRFEYIYVLVKGKPNTFNPLRDTPNKYAGRLSKSNTKRLKTGETISTGDYVVPKTRMRDNVWSYSVGYNNSTTDKQAYKHPALMPESLTHDLMVSWSNPGDLVLDPMAGAGTTLKVAKQTDRHFVGVECSPEYVAIAQSRLASLPA